MVSVTTRVTALERFRRRGGYTDAETLRILALPPAELAALAAELGVER